MIVHIVIDKSTDVLKNYSEQYKVFNNFDKALTHAKDCGYETFFMTPKPELGMLNSYICGDKDISIMTVEVEE